MLMPDRRGKSDATLISTQVWGKALGPRTLNRKNVKFLVERCQPFPAQESGILVED
jgi:hypothetical protein